jgi:hypothetical protein
MLRVQAAIGLLLAVSSCQSPQFPHSDKTFCRKHHVPLVTVQTFTPENMVGMEYGDERVCECEKKWPNCLPAALVLHRTKVFNMPFAYSYCPLCEGEFQKCSKQFQHK